jgi:hypothetical protein
LTHQLADNVIRETHEDTMTNEDESSKAAMLPSSDGSSSEPSSPSQPTRRSPRVRTIDDGIALLRQREVEQMRKRDTEMDVLVLQTVLPGFDDENRAVPNHFIRSGLFSVGQERNRAYRKNDKVVSLSNYDIRATGEELYQEDLSVWMALLCRAKDSPISHVVHFTAYSVIRDLGWTVNSKSYERLKDSIRRLKNTALEIATSDAKNAYSGSLIRDYAFATKDSDETTWWVRFEPKMAKLLLSDTTTFLEWQLRKQIGSRATLCLWLHGFYSSHRDPIHPYSIEKIRDLCGSRTNHLPSFQRSLEAAVNRLRELGFLSDWRITAGMLHVKKHPRFAKLPSATITRIGGPAKEATG